MLTSKRYYVMSITKGFWDGEGPPTRPLPVFGWDGVTPLKVMGFLPPPDSARNHVADHVSSNRTYKFPKGSPTDAEL